jgi:NADP-dependent 3-hydroxy acid dehydrogenase YdfG
VASLKGKVVLLTGASSGIGEAAARLFAQEGWRTVLAARRFDRLEQLASEIRNAGGEALPVAMDVTQPQQIDSAVGAALSAYGQIDVLFNNAGFGRLDWLEALDPLQDIQAQLAVDLVGVILAARAVLPSMYARHGGHIINMSSVAGLIAPPLYSIYSAGKFGVRGFSEALRREALPMGVHVSVVYPGSVRTEFGQHIGTGAAKRRFKTPPWLTLSAEDVARSVVSLAHHPRRERVMPWFMVAARFLNSHFNGLSDVVQTRASKNYHMDGRY